MAKANYQIPFDSDGNQLHYPESWRPGGVQWRDNAPFNATLSYSEYSRGRSAAYFIFKREDGREVTVFLKDFESMVPHMVKGTITGTFQFTKRGMNYGCQLVEST